MNEVANQLADALSERYRIVRELGAGGMATVYLAEDLKHKRRVAIKVLRPALAALLGPDRFLKEIETVARLNHPHILALHDSGEIEGFLYYVMPVVAGESLRERLNRERQLPIEDAIKLTEQVASALDYAHRQGVIHRDIKPENILIHEGEAMVTDFGIALAINEAGGTRLTEAGFSLGTPEYMSPEQASGTIDIDARSDIYGLGCVLYEMIAGQPPFIGATLQSILRQHIVSDPPSIDGLRANVPRTISAGVGAMLAKIPAERPDTAGNAVKAFGKSADRPVTIPPSRGRMGIVIGAIATFVVVAAVWSWIQTTADIAEPVTDVPRLIVLPAEHLGDPADSLFTVGLTVEITDRLAGLTGLVVEPRSAAQRYRRNPRPPTEIHEELGVDYVLSGTTRWAKDDDSITTVRVGLQLVDAQTGVHVWTLNLDRDLSNALTIQSEVASRVIDALGLTLVGPDSTGGATLATTSSRANREYLRGRALFSADRTQLADALHAFELAVAADPEFAQAHAWLSIGLSSQVRSAHVPNSAEQQTAALTAAEKAMELDPTLPEAHFALGAYHYYLRGDRDAAREAFRDALIRRPNYQDAARNLAHIEKDLGNLQEALTVYVELSDRFPDSRPAAWSATETFIALREYTEAQRFARRWSGIEENPTSPFDGIAPTMFLALTVLMQTGSPEDVRGVLQSALERGVISRNDQLDGPVADPYLKLLVQAELNWAWEPVVRVLCTVGGDDCTQGVAAVVLTDAERVWSQHNYYYQKARLFDITRQPVQARFYYDSAATVVEQLLVDHPNDAHFLAELGLFYTAAGRSDDALQTAGRAEAAIRNTIWNSWANYAPLLAELYMRLGRKDHAIDWLETLIERPSFISRELLRVDPLWDDLRDEPSFQMLIAPIGVETESRR